jgi:hypothetical protein
MCRILGSAGSVSHQRLGPNTCSAFGMTLEALESRLAVFPLASDDHC